MKKSARAYYVEGFGVGGGVPRVEVVKQLEDEDEDEYKDEDGPNEGDYVINCTGSRYIIIEIGDAHFCRSIIEESDAYAIIKERMEAEHFWPNVWTCSDHGNLELVSLESLKG